MENRKDTYEAYFMAQVEEKILEMERENYEFPKRFSKKDYIVTAIVILLCLAGVIGGAFIV